MLLEGFIHYQTRDDLKYESLEFDNVIYEQGVRIYTDKGSKGSRHYRIFVGSEAHRSVAFKTCNPPHFPDILSKADFESACAIPELNVHLGIWVDTQAKTVHIYRDPFGTVPLYYYHIAGKCFVFSTDLVRLKSHYSHIKPLDINRERIISYLNDDLTNTRDLAKSTFYSELFAVPPGYMLSVSANNVSASPFVSLKPQKWEHLTTVEEYGEILKEKLLKSVASCTGHATLVATHLSGGLDSSSMASIYRHLNPLLDFHTLHIQANHKESDESGYAEDVARSVGSKHHNFDQPLNDLELLIQSTNLFGQPNISFLSPAANVGSISFLADHGCDVLITGHGGDSVIGSGFEAPQAAFMEKNWTHFSELLKKRVPYSMLAAEDSGWDEYSFEKQYHLVLQNFLYSQIPLLRKLPPTQLILRLSDLYRHLGLSFTYVAQRAAGNFLKRLRREHVVSPNTIATEELLAAKIPAKTGPSNAAILRGSLPQKYQELFEDVFHPHIIRGQEQHFALGTHFGLPILAPYMNLDILEICMAVPDLLKYGEGKGREHLRQAMKDILPDSIQKRATKATLSSPDGHEMTYRLLTQSRELLTAKSKVWDYVDRDAFLQQVAVFNNDKIPYTQKSRSYFHITRTIALAVWLSSSR